MAVERAVGARVAVTTAMEPGAIVFVFMPIARQVYAPGVAAHERDFPAAVDAAPMSTDNAVISAVE